MESIVAIVHEIAASQKPDRDAEGASIAQTKVPPRNRHTIRRLDAVRLTPDGSIAATSNARPPERQVYTAPLSTMNNHPHRDRVLARLSVGFLIVVGLAMGDAASVLAQIKAQARSAPTPPWSKGILPISPESYYNAIECGKQGGEDPPCVFFDTGLCKNDDFTLALYTPYKMVAYEVWRVVRQKKPAPTPSYQTAQQTRITIGVTPVRGSRNPLTNLVLTKGGRVVMPVDRSVDETGGRFTFDYPAFAATGDITLDLVGRAKSVVCLIDTSVLVQFR
jgi:hypothetical protein